MIIKDERTLAQKASLTWLVVGTDAFFEKWRKGKLVGNCYIAYACLATDVCTVEAWVRHRSEIKRVRIVMAKTWRPRGNGMTHIYAVETGHPALAQ